MQGAYAVLVNPDLRRRYDESRDATARAPRSSASPDDELNRIRREGKRRQRFARKMADDTQRCSDRAIARHADELRRLEQDFDELAAAAALGGRGGGFAVAAPVAACGRSAG